MATPQYSTTSDTTNAGRASRVLLGPCSAQLRDLLQDHVPPQKFPQIIRQKMANHKWTKPQRDLILPSTGQYSGNYSDFDISLLYTLLRNLCNIPKHKNGWGNDPDPNDMSLSANIERIRICRNRLGHALDFSLSDLEFNDIWSSISTAVIEIDKVLKSNHKHEKDVDFLRYEPMDFAMASSFEKVLRKQYMEDIEIKLQLSESHNVLGKQLNDISSKQDMMAKQLETWTKRVCLDHQRNGRSTKIKVQRTNQYLEFLRWILTVFGLLRIFNFFWNTEELRKLDATEISDCSVSLKWDHTANERERQETSYIIAYRKTSSEDNVQRITVNCCEYKIETLQHNTEYEVQINVLTSSGEKELSKKIIFKTEELRELKVTEVSDCSVLLMWESRKEKQETSYIIEYRNTNLEDNVQRITLKGCEHKLDTLQHSTEYEVQVKVATSSGEKEHSKQIKFKTEELRKLETTEISYRSVLLNWEDRRGRQKTSYIIAYRCTNSENMNRIIVNSCGHRLDNLKHSTEYEVQVKVMTSSGEKKHSTKKHFKTEGLQKLKYEDITVSSVLLKWKPKNNTQGDCPRGEEGVYIIEYVNAEPDSKTKRVEVKSCEYQLEKLKHSTEYRVQIKVKTDSGEYQHTEKVTFETEQIQPAPRLPFRTVQITPSSITAEWGNCEKWLSDQQRHYILTCTKNSESHSEDSESKTEIIEVNQDVLPVQKCKGTVSELISNTIYSLKVKAENGNVVSRELVMESPTKTKVDALIEPFSSSEEARLYIRKTYENLTTDVLDKIDTDMLAEYLLQMAIISKNSFDDIKGANLLKKNDLIVKNVLAKRNTAEYPYENFWEALDFYLPHTKQKLVENARKNEEQIPLSSPSLSWNFINDHRDELDVDDVLNTAHALFADEYIDDSEHDEILLSKSPSKKVEALMNIVSEKENKVLFLRAFEARCNRTQLEELFERQKNSESATNSQTGAGLDISQQDVEETAQPEEVSAQLILTGDEDILSRMFENPNCMKDLRDMIENNVIKVKLSKQNSIVIELSSSSETSYTEFVKILKEGRIDDFIEYLLAKHNISKVSPEGNTKIKLRLSTLPPAEDQSKLKEKILRRSFPHVLHKCLPNSIMEEIKKLKLPTQFHKKLLEGLNKSDNDDNLKKNRFLMTMLLREDTISEESTRCLMKNLVGSDILNYELKRNTGDIVGKIGENYGHILRELHGNIIMKMNEIYAVFGDEVFRSDSKSKQDRSALFLEDVLTKESKVLDLANVLSMLELDSLLHDKESEIGQVKCAQKKGQFCHVVYERQMEIPLADEESRAACKYSSMQETNAERASHILLGPCEDQLRDVLRHHVPPAIFHDAITRHRSNLLLTQSQTEIILPRTGRYSGDYSDMNISLLYSLLRNICKIPSHRNGWGKTPDISDSSLSASIDRIWMARNTIVHCSRTILFQKEFNDLLIEIKMAVISIDSYLGNSNTYEKAVDSLLTETMNQEQDVFIQQLRKLVEEDETMLERNKTEKRIHVHKRARRLDTELGGLDRKFERHDNPIQKHDKEMRRQVQGKGGDEKDDEVKRSFSSTSFQESKRIKRKYDTMAASKYPSTPEITDTNRASRILLGPCTDQLRDLLRQRVPPARFHHVITRNWSKLPRLTQPQRDVILPRPGHYSGDYSDMDISLLYLLLRNICNISAHTNGWGNTPDISDTSLSASIDRIREARNGVVHSSSTSVTQTEFNALLHDIKIAVIAMDSHLGNSNKYEKAVDFLLTETMDPEQDTFIQQLKKQVEEDKTTMERVSKREKPVNEEFTTLHEGVQRIDTGMQKNTRDIEYIRRQVIEKQSVQGKGEEKKEGEVRRSRWDSFIQKLRRKKKYDTMAASKYLSTPEITDTNRASRILLGPCTDQLRDLLRQRVPPARFHHVITRNWSKLPRLTQNQRDVILPRPGRYSGDYSDMDMSLLYLLLRNICNISAHTNGWGNTPDVSDSSLSASIDRIREARNGVVHSSSTSLTQTEFNSLLHDIKIAVIAIDSHLGNSNEYEKAVDFLLTETMDPEQDTFIQQLKKQVEEDKTTMERVSKLEKPVNEEFTTLHEGVQRIDIGMQKNTRDIEYIRRQVIEKQSVQGKGEEKKEGEVRRSRWDSFIQKLRRKKNYVEPDVSVLKQKLIEKNNKETGDIPLSLVTTDGDKLPIEHLFSTVVIRENVKENPKGKTSAQRQEQQDGKEVKSPEDILTKNGKPVPRVFMLGKAAHGKTKYCKWFLKTWCNTQQGGGRRKLRNKWENALSQFDFVFHIPLRHVDTSRANVTDMICLDILGSDTVLHTTAKHVLSSDKYRCFIMMDGLDWWKPDQSVIDRLKYKGMPNIDNMSNCVIFTTMRPWKFSEVEGVNSEDRVIEIQGLDDAGIESVIEKVLVYYHEMKPDTAEYKAKCKEIKNNLDNETVKSFIKIPSLAVVCVQIWYDGEQIGDSMTSFYIAMVNMLIQRAHLKHDTQKLSFESINVSLPKQMSTKKNIKNYFNVLLELGKVAYEGLLSKEMKLVFQKDDLETEIGKRELQFALDVGLISQRDVHSVMEEKVSVHFFHKSVQEFLAAINIVTNKEVSDLFCKHLCDIKVIMELSNVIMFICGMCPCLGSVISQRVVSVADSDTEICKYRESPFGGHNTVSELYKLQVSWCRELEYGQTDSPVTDSPVTFHVSDVDLSKYSDIETVRVTRELMSDHHIDIRSLYLWGVPTDGDLGITNTVVNVFLGDLHRTRSLAKIDIIGDTDRTINKVFGPSLTTLYLRDVKVANTNTVPGPVLCQCDMLQGLWLNNVTLGDRDLGLTPNMALLREVTLQGVNMTSSGWGRWLQSVIDIYHQFVVTLLGTNIDRHNVSTIHSSPHLYVTWDDRFVLKFTRVWPLTQDTQ